MEMLNREFKAVVQDMTHVYLGAQMTVKEMMSYEDVPFKVKAIFNKYFGSHEQTEMKVCDLMGSVDSSDFAYQVIKQLKIKFKVGIYTVKRNSEVYKSKTLSPDEFYELYASGEKIFVEEIVFNKLALLAFST
ncbi:MAG: hypothetical protein K5776_11555 [Lachnospiraceae bacterium]|nr:hypothetical protein [Lachnospiraceae bacterium]